MIWNIEFGLQNNNNRSMKYCYGKSIFWVDWRRLVTQECPLQSCLADGKFVVWKKEKTYTRTHIFQEFWYDTKQWYSSIVLNHLFIRLDTVTGTKFATFHTFGKQPLSSCLLNRVQRGIDKDFEHSFNRWYNFFKK